MVLRGALKRGAGMLVVVAMLLAPALLTACDSSIGAVTVHYTAYYFQSFYVPDTQSATPLVCATSSGANQWYVYVNIDGIDNSATGAADFTFDPSNLQALHPDTDSEMALWAGDLDPYWQPQPVSVPAGQSLDSTHVHQGKFFQINYAAPMPATDLPDIPPVVYHTASTSGPVLWLSNPHHLISPPNSAQPTNQFLADVHDVPLVEAGPCSA